MTEEEKIKQIFYDYETAGLVEGDPIKVLSLLSDDLIGIGMGEQGFVPSKKKVRDIMLETVRKDASASYELQYRDVAVNLSTEKTANLCGHVSVKRHCGGETTVSGFWQSLSLVLREGVWRICAVHASPDMLSEESIKSFPLDFADSTLTNLRGELREEAFQFLSESLSVGILGAYVDDEDLPPFYVNDSLLNLLGYTQAEFFEVMAADSFAVVFPDDRERAQREIGEAIEKGPVYTCQYRLLTKSGETRWVVEHGKLSKQDGRDAILSAFVDVSELMGLQMALKEKNDTILSSVNYAGRIQKNLLPPDKLFEKVFSDYSVLWSPKDIVGGDVYWLREFPQGTVLCVADCTGHGIPGALLTMVISTALDNAVREDHCGDTARILYELDQRIRQILHSNERAENAILDIRDGCDLAVIFVAKDGSVTFSSTNTQIFVCDGREVRRYRGQRLNIGEGRLDGPEKVKRISLPASKEAAYYVVTDGLLDQPDAPGGRPFGIRRFQELALEYSDKKQREISEKIWEAFEKHRGSQPRRDDVALISFRP